MRAADEIARQLCDELSGVVSPVLATIDPRLRLDVEQRIRSAAPVLAAQLLQDDRLAAQTCIDVMCALWPHGAPEQVGRADWWRTPLGRACARSLGLDDAESVSHSVAAAMLGVHRGTVAQLVARGKLDRHPDGGVLRASVLARIVDQSRPGGRRRSHSATSYLTRPLTWTTTDVRTTPAQRVGPTREEEERC